MKLRVPVVLLLGVVCSVPAVRADDPPKPMDEAALKSDAAIKQERLAIQFREFEQKLLRLAQRMELSSKPEDLDRAKILKKAIKDSSEKGVDARFDQLVGTLKSTKVLDLDSVQGIMQQNKELADDLRAILQILLTDNRDAELAAERKRIENLLKQFDRIIRDQKNARAWTERGGKGKEQLGKEQDAVTDATKALAKALDKNQGEGKEGKGEGKGAGKGKGKKGDGKDDTGQEKVAKKDEEPKSDDRRGGIKERQKKEEGDQADAKTAGKQGDGSQGGGKGSPKEGEQVAKGGSPSEAKNKSDGKGEGKPGGQQGGQGQQQQAQSKGGGESGQQAQAKGQQQPQNQNNQQAQNTPGRKQVEDATQNQQRASDNIAKEERKKASEEQTEAIKKLEEARKKLEEMLAQLRQEELERLLAALQARCERMLQMQIEVRDGTVALQKTIEATTDRKPTRTEFQKSLQLSDRENEIVRECTRAKMLVQAEGSAVAFAEVFVQVEGDMKNVAERLHRTDAGVVTQTIEQDIIDTLKEMIEALKKARKDNQNKEGKPGQGGGKQPDPKLIDMLAELKMIRSMQIRVNSRTVTYAREYQGEQAPVPDAGGTPEEREKYEMIQRELRGLSDRQRKIFEVVNNIARGKNEGTRP